EAVRSEPERLSVHVALTAPLGVPVDGEPRAAALRTAEALAELGHDVREQAPEWDDESFPASWGTFATGAGQHLLRVVERLPGRLVDVERLGLATRAWLVDSEPVALVDYLEACERLWAFGRRILGSWPADRILVTPTLTRLPAQVGSLRSRAGV